MGGDLAGQAKKRDVIETSGIIWDINGIEGDIYIMYIASNTGRFMGKNAGHKWGGGVSRVICFFLPQNRYGMYTRLNQNSCV